jgi:pseudouridine synthase
MAAKSEDGLRLQVFLARAGIASRRAAEELIRNGVVTVNGELVTGLGTKIDPAADTVKVRGKMVKTQSRSAHYMLNKPRGVVSTASDPEGRETVLDLVKVKGIRLFPVGRLDLQSEGLILLTNDGDLAQRLLHPKFEVPRSYHAKIRGHLDAKALKRLREGVMLDGKRTQPLTVRPIRSLPNASWVDVTVKEGRQHLVRDALDAVGHPVVKLKRVSFGPLKLGRLALGESRPLKDAEVEALRGVAEGAPAKSRKGFAKARRSPARKTRPKSAPKRGSRTKR